MKNGTRKKTSNTTASSAWPISWATENARIRGARMPRPRIPSTRANQPAGEKNQHAAHDNLEHGREQRCVHVAFANPGYDRQFHSHHPERDGRGEMKIADEIGQGVAQTAEGCHQAADRAAYPGCAAPAEFAIVGQRLGEAHADAGAD